MAVKIGHARYDENGKAYGGKSGDQTGNEVCISNWYLNSKGWYVLRAKDAAVAEKMAVCMEAACANNKIGYDQHQRDTLYNLVKSLGYDCAKVTTACETDCSALVRVCLGFAGIMVANFNTASEVATIMNTGKFEKLTSSKYCTKSDNLKRGDILVTRSKGHTVIVLSNGANAQPTTISTPMIKKGSKGSAVTNAQKLLVEAGQKLPKYGADGDFGAETDAATRKYQKAKGLEVDGIIGPKTWAALLKE